MDSVGLFCLFARKLETNIVKKFMDTATKTRIDTAKTASTRVV